MTAVPSHVPPARPTSARSDARSELDATDHTTFGFACIVIGVALLMAGMAAGEMRTSVARHLDQASAIAQMDPPRAAQR